MNKLHSFLTHVWLMGACGNFGAIMSGTTIGLEDNDFEVINVHKLVPVILGGMIGATIGYEIAEIVDYIDEKYDGINNSFFFNAHKKDCSGSLIEYDDQ